MKKNSRVLVLFCGLAASFCSNIAIATTLDEYLAQVRGENKELSGTRGVAEAAKLKSVESNLLFMPNFFAEARTSSDGKPSNPPLLTYDHIENQTYSLGISQQFSFGLQAKIYYQATHTNFIGSPVLSGSNADFYDANPRLELALPLWGNGFGRTLRAQRDLIARSNQVEEFGMKAQNVTSDIEAENTYWSLVVNQELLKVQRQALHQAETILDYVKNRARMRLGEESDILQAQALVASRKLDLKRGETTEASARIRFNALRNILSDKVTDTLDPVPFEMILQLNLPNQRPGNRYDVIAAQAQTEAASSNAMLVSERNTPTLDLYGGYGLNGRDSSFSNASSNLNGGDKGSKYIGLRLNLPLDLGSSAAARLGARLSVESQREIFEQKKIYQERDWHLTVQQFKDAKESLTLANSLVAAQDAKLKAEKSRLKIGKTTTYQVLLFEQDKSQSEIARLQLASQILALRPVMRAYQAASAEGEN